MEKLGELLQYVYGAALEITTVVFIALLFTIGCPNHPNQKRIQFANMKRHTKMAPIKLTISYLLTTGEEKAELAL